MFNSPNLTPVSFISRLTPTALTSNTPTRIETGMKERTGITVHSHSTSAVAVLGTIAIPSVTVDNTYVQTTGHKDFQLSPGDSIDVTIGEGLYLYLTAVSGTATVSGAEYR